MTGIDERDCGRITGLLDVYLDGELPASEMTGVAAHLGGCAGCKAEAGARTAFRDRLRKAVRGTPAPDDLDRQVLRSMRSSTTSRFRAPQPDIKRFLAIAAVAVLTLSIAAYKMRLPGNGGTSPDSYLAELSNETAPIIRVGLSDHVHCAVFRKYPANPPSLEEMTASLGPEFADLVPAMASRIPEGMKVVLAHKCKFKGREYVHLIARDERNLVSLVIAKRSEGEAFESDLKAVVNGSDLPVYSAAVRQFAIAGFETPEHLVYLISDMNPDTNLHMMRAMAAPVRQALLKNEG
jgi:hypothetical protein